MRMILPSVFQGGVARGGNCEESLEEDVEGRGSEGDQYVIVTMREEEEMIEEEAMKEQPEAKEDAVESDDPLLIKWGQ